MTDFINKIIAGNCLNILPQLPEKIYSAVITSPPYWGLRAYKSMPQIWGGQADCQHIWGNEYFRETARSDGGRKSKSFHGHKNNYAGQTIKERKPIASQGQFCQLCGDWQGEHGLEPTPELYIRHSMMVFAEVKRVLRDDGILFVNIGDTYAGGKGQSGQGSPEYQELRKDKAISKPYSHIGGKGKTRPSNGNFGISAKSLCAIPERFVLAMAEHGWIRRCTLIWAKALSFCEKYSGSCMPDSCQDRPNKNGFEYVYMFTKKKRYYYEQQYEDVQESTLQRDKYTRILKKDGPQTIRHDHETPSNPLGRVIRNVWAINPQPYPDAHYATFPEELIRPMIKMAVPEFVCKKCGKPRKKIYGESKGGTKGKSWREHKKDEIIGARIDTNRRNDKSITKGNFKGYTNCGCKAGWRPGVCLDPFLRVWDGRQGGRAGKKGLYIDRLAA